MFQRLPFQVLHCDERTAIVFIDFVDGADVGMIQRRCGLSFPLKSGQCLRVFGNFIRKELQGHKAFQLRVFGFVNDTHSSATELLDNAVMGYVLADHAREGSGSAVILRAKMASRKPLSGSCIKPQENMGCPVQ